MSLCLLGTVGCETMEEEEENDDSRESVDEDRRESQDEEESVKKEEKKERENDSESECKVECVGEIDEEWEVPVQASAGPFESKDKVEASGRDEKKQRLSQAYGKQKAGKERTKCGGKKGALTPFKMEKKADNKLKDEGWEEAVTESFSSRKQEGGDLQSRLKMSSAESEKGMAD